LAALGARELFLAQLRQQRRVPGHGPQVKKHTAVQQRHGLRLVNPFAKVAPPLRQRLAPLRMHGHHLAGAMDVAAGIQPIADKAGKVGEVRAVLHRVVLVGQHQGVVLVGAGRLLLPRLRPCGHPHPGHWRRPELLLCQGNQAGGDGIGHRGDDAANALRPGPAVYQGLLQGWHLGTELGQGGNVRCLVNAPGQLHHAGTLARVHIARGDDAQHPGLAQHRHVVDVVLRHQRQRVQGAGLRRQAVQGGAGNLAQRQGGG